MRLFTSTGVLFVLVQAVWTRFFPASLEISRLLSQSAVGEVKMVRVDFGVPIMQISRAVQKDLGGGALLDIGIYCLQFVLMVYNGEKPQCVQATGVCLDTGTELTGHSQTNTTSGDQRSREVFVCCDTFQV